MIFSVQRYLEDYFERRGLSDIDQYAVKVANVYIQRRSGTNKTHLRRSIRSIRTAFYRNNPQIDRSDFEQKLVEQLARHFQKKSHSSLKTFPGGVSQELTKIRTKSRLTIRQILERFRSAIESRAIDLFWKSRRNERLRSRPEEIAQGLLAVFVKAIMQRLESGYMLREFLSGIGYVDVGIILSSIIHLVELKVISSSFDGVSQLQTYMKTEERNEGWLVVLDARPSSKRNSIPVKIETSDGVVRVIHIDINPTPPSRRGTIRPSARPGPKGSGEKRGGIGGDQGGQARVGGKTSEMRGLGSGLAIQHHRRPEGIA